MESFGTETAATVEYALMTMPEGAVQEADRKTRQVLEEFGSVTSLDSLWQLWEKSDTIGV
jgi:hypothetical protein